MLFLWIQGTLIVVHSINFNDHKQETVFCLVYQIVISLLLLTLYPLRA